MGQTALILVVIAVVLIAIPIIQARRHLVASNASVGMALSGVIVACVAFLLGMVEFARWAFGLMQGVPT